MSSPLKGLKVLDFTTLLPGPYATQLLADMGAEVLRVEAPNRPDLLKLMPPKVGKVSAAHASINRNKRAVAIDLKQPEAKEIIHKLVAEYDVIVEQFRPGVMQRLGLDYASLKAIQPRLIYCSITGYGQTGPYKDRAGHDINYLALSGLASFSGRQDTGPVLSGTQVADIAGGSHHAVMAILAAAFQRAQSGEGQYLDISMADAALALTTMFGANALASGRDPEAGKEMLNGGLFYDYYKTRDGRYLSVGSLEPNFASGLLSALGLQSLMSSIADQRPAAQQSLRAAIANKIASENLAHWKQVFEQLDVCVEPVLSLSETRQHPQFEARQMFCEAADEAGTRIPQIASPLPFKHHAVAQAGRELGADTREVLLALGYSDDEIAALQARACIKLA